MTASTKDTANELIDYLDSLTTDLRAELDEHRESINDNTDEISIQNSAICEIDNRLNKLEEKLDKFHFMFKQMLSRSLVSIDLTKEEQKTFLILYTHDGFQSVEDINSKSDLESGEVEESLMSLMDKGVPVEREILNKGVYFRLNKEFRLRQAKEKLVRIDPEVKQQYQNALLNKFFHTEA